MMASHVFLPYGGLATNGLQASLGLPGPAGFTAITLNWYSLPSFRSLRVIVTVSPGVSPALVQREENRSFCSTIYSVMSAPPLLEGGDHSRWTDVSVMSDGTGVLGAPGTSEWL